MSPEERAERDQIAAVLDVLLCIASLPPLEVPPDLSPEKHWLEPAQLPHKARRRDAA